MGNQVVVEEKPVREQIREQKRAIDRCIRNIERERRRIETDERKMKAEIKKMAKNGQNKAARMLARDIVRAKVQKEKMNEFCGQLKAVSLRISSVSSLNELSMAMNEAGNAIMTVSNKLDSGKLAEMSKVLIKEDAKLDMKADMMSEIMDSLGEGMDNPVEEENLYQQVLKDVGIEVEESIPEAKKKVGPQKEAAKEEEEEDPLAKMLNQLQNPGAK